MTIDRKLAELLRCPVTGQPVTPATRSQLKALNEAAAEGTLTHLDGRPVEQTLEAALITVDLARVYPVRDGIPVMLAEECIAPGHALDPD